MTDPLTTENGEVEALVVAQGAVPAMRELCDLLRDHGIGAALTAPPGGAGKG